jgi:2-oxoglutarate dehydrogenase E2 component (dihydrolipoamide succinyltransferase)
VTSVKPAPGSQERKKMTKVRQTIAANLVASKQQSAHLTTFNEVDMSAAMAIRSKYKQQFEEKHGVRLGFMSFFVKAAQRALVDHPSVNAFVDGTEIIYNYFYNVGVAISTDAGLLVPVLRNVDTMGFAEIESKIVDFATRARARRLLPDEFAGGTFTITNGGVFGSMLSTPIPSPPQTAVLGMHAITKRAVVVDDEIVIRPMMYLALTYDHRIIDGREAIGFLNRIKSQIEDPPQLMLDL